MIDPDFIGGLLGFLNFETCKCPNCGIVLSKDEIARNANKEGNIFVCPKCSYAGNIDGIKAKK